MHCTDINTSDTCGSHMKIAWWLSQTMMNMTFPLQVQERRLVMERLVRKRLLLLKISNRSSPEMNSLHLFENYFTKSSQIKAIHLSMMIRSMEWDSVI